MRMMKVLRMTGRISYSQHMALEEKIRNLFIHDLYKLGEDAFGMLPNGDMMTTFEFYGIVPPDSYKQVTLLEETLIKIGARVDRKTLVDIEVDDKQP